MNFPVASNDIILFQAAEAIEKTLKALHHAKAAVKVTKDAFLKEYYKKDIQFETNKYYSDLNWFSKLAGHDGWKQYV